MITYLPHSVEIKGVNYDIRYDFHAALDIIEAMTDPELENKEKAYVILNIFYVDFRKIPLKYYGEAVDRVYWFISGGQEKEKSGGKKLVEWSQDFPIIISPVNRVIGHEIRNDEYLHWWTFISGYMEIGDCLFAQVVNIRNKKLKGKRLDKHEQEFYRNNRDLVDIKNTYTKEEKELLAQWGV